MNEAQTIHFEETVISDKALKEDLDTEIELDDLPV